MRLVVGCPVRQREWILDTWFQHVEDSCGQVGVEPVYVFVVDPTDSSFPVIERLADHAEVHVELVDEKPETELRSWDRRDRLEHMVTVRNRLLARVRLIGPELFWSVDSDILVDPGSLAAAMDFMAAHGLDAVATLTWMNPVGFTCPNFGIWDRANGGFRRFPAEPGGQYDTQIIMAIKLMDVAAYSVDYALPEQYDLGEDIGWSLACRAQGLGLGVDCTKPAKHVMKPGLELVEDRRLGW